LIDSYASAPEDQKESYLADIRELGSNAGYDDSNIIARVRAGFASAPERAGKVALTSSQAAVNTGRANTSYLLNWALEHSQFTNRDDAAAAVQHAYDTATKTIDSDITKIGVPNHDELVEQLATQILMEGMQQSGAGPGVDGAAATHVESQDDKNWKTLMSIAFPSGAQ